ncbi:MAG: calcium/sodium antiporter [Phycisphaeraceae bacterium]
MSVETLIFLIAGFALLAIGGELLVRGSTKLAGALGISPLVIGLTVVAFGTSAPELAVSVNAAFMDQADIAIGNVVGSNIANVLLILGISAVVAPLMVNVQLIRIDIPIMIGASVVMWVMCLDGMISRLDGIILVMLLISYLTLAVVLGRRESRRVAAEYAAAQGEPPKETSRILLQFVFIIAGLGLLVLGANWFVEGAVSIAKALGVSELIIGLTVVAIGTSMPELAASIVASVKGQRDIAAGNVIGSNLFNILCILGITALVAPAGIKVDPSALNFDIPIMTAVAVACFPIFFHGQRIERWEGALFLFYYAAYMIYLVMDSVRAKDPSGDYATLRTFGMVMMTVVVPLTVVTLLVCVVRQVRHNAAARRGDSAC